MRSQRGKFRRRGLGAPGEQGINAVLIDFRLAGAGGSDLAAAAKHAQPGINVILTVEGIGNVPAQQSLRLRGYPLLIKPLKIEELARALEAPPEAPPSPPPELAPTAPEQNPTEFAGLVGDSERMKKIYRLISKVALQRHPVLITGESGTGKELVARAIHSRGPWRDQPFVPVDCGALPPTLIESELFRARERRLYRSRPIAAGTAGGGLLWDSVPRRNRRTADPVESRLLRALQEHEIRPLGSNERVRFEARIIAATNQDLEQGIKRGIFRKDLFFRLNVVSIKMPSLRDRKEDIPVLARHFLKRLESQKSVTQISDEVLGRLMSYDWPGNVRELENCIQRAVSLGSGKFSRNA